MFGLFVNVFNLFPCRLQSSYFTDKSSLSNLEKMRKGILVPPSPIMSLRSETLIVIWSTLMLALTDGKLLALLA